jgi:hypothetical protein
MYSLHESLSGSIGIEHLTIFNLEAVANLDSLFRSLSTHPRITRLSLRCVGVSPFGRVPSLSAMNAIIQMLDHNGGTYNRGYQMLSMTRVYRTPSSLD